MNETYVLNGVVYKINPSGSYALYKKSEGVWRESSSVTNKMLMEIKNGVIRKV